MTDNEIKSPLPPRKMTIASSDEPVDRVKALDSVLPPITPEPPANNVLTPAKKEFPKKFLIAGIAGIVLILLLLVGYKVLLPILSGSKNEPVTINYWGLWEDSPVMNSIIADFEAKNPGIKVNYSMSQKTDYRTRLAGRLAKTGDDQDVPDVFRFHNTWIPMFKDNLAPVPSTISTAIGLDADFYDTYKTSLKSGGQYLAVPLMYDGLALYYNKDLIESGQVNLPKSWWDLKSAADKLTVKDAEEKIKVAGVAMGLVDNVDHWSDILGLMMKQNGVDPLSQDPANVKKMQDVLTFYTMFRTQDHVWDESLPSSTQMFANGKLAFYFGPSWRVFNINDLNKDLRYDITTVPQLPTLDNAPIDQANPDAKLTNINWASYWVEGVNNKSKHQAEAWKFLQYLASAEGLEKMYATASQTRAFGEIYPRKSMAAKIITNTKIKPYVSVANDASSWYLSSETHDSGLNDNMAKYFGDAINSIVLKSQGMEVVMPSLTQGINQLKIQYQLK